MYEIKLTDMIPKEMIHKAIEMDHRVFRLSDWITQEDADLIYRNKTDCIIWLQKEEQPIGFITIFALNSNLPIEAVKKNKPIYKLLTQEALTDQVTGILYCHCFLLLPEYRGKGLIYQLYEGLKLWLEKKGEHYTALYADAVSSDGSRCLERLGFSAIHSFGEEGTLYKADKADVIQMIEKQCLSKH